MMAAFINSADVHTCFASTVNAPVEDNRKIANAAEEAAAADKAQVSMRITHSPL